MTEPLLRKITPSQLPPKRQNAVDEKTLSIAGQIVCDVRENGESALLAWAIKLGDLKSGDQMIYWPGDLADAYERLDEHAKGILSRTAKRIERFAKAQLACLCDLSIEIEGGRAGHTISPVDRAACYAPGGRFPLPSSVLMTALTAKISGVKSVWVASPRPTDETLAAAHLAGADALLAVGGAQAIAAFAFGAGPVSRCDAIVGPGNRFVTAAKQMVSGKVAIDMPAGPSELVVLADDTADPRLIAADLLAQAEHDPDAFPALVAIGEAIADRVEVELQSQITDLPTEQNARAACKNGFAVIVPSIDDAIKICDTLAPEHLEVMVQNAREVSGRLNHYGALFIGQTSAETLGDYGAGPNHVLPTGGAARFTGGLSVLAFLRVRTWMKIDNPTGAAGLLDDAAALARLEGLEAHARAALLRKPK